MLILCNACLKLHVGVCLRLKARVLQISFYGVKEQPCREGEPRTARQSLHTEAVVQVPGCSLCVLRLLGNNYLLFCHVSVLLWQNHQWYSGSFLNALSIS